MNAREKTLALLVGGVVVLLGGALGIRAFISKPLNEIDKRIDAVRRNIAKAQEERRAFFSAEEKLKVVGLGTFSDSIDEASASSGEMLTKTIMQSGLKESEFTRLPAGPRKLRGASEIGWSVQGQGRLTNLVNLLFTLNESPYLHQVDSLVVNAGDAPGLVKVRFRYLTLVLEPAPDITRKPLVATMDLSSPQRALLESIATRDLLRPYIKRPPPELARNGAPASAPAGPESFKIVSLSEWDGQPEIHVRDQVNERTTRYKIGDKLLDGTIVMIDYRGKPMPGHELVQSFSRVIVKVNSDFWAIEKGKTLSEKRKLNINELPPELATSIK